MENIAWEQQTSLFCAQKLLVKTKWLKQTFSIFPLESADFTSHLTKKLLTVIMHSSLFLCSGNMGSSRVLHWPLATTVGNLDMVLMYRFSLSCRAFLSVLISAIPLSHSLVQWYNMPILHTWAGYWGKRKCCG